MIGPMQVDDWLISKSTKFAHWFQRLTGRTNFFLAKLGLLICGINVVLVIANYFTQFLAIRTPLFVTFIYTLVLFLLVGYTVKLDEADRSQQQSEERAKVSITSSSALIWRMYWLINLLLQCPIAILTFEPTLVGILKEICSIGFFLGMVIFHYFIVVDPLPPRKSRIRQWVENISFGLSEPVRARSDG
jgi:hypothetical protein